MARPDRPIRSFLLAGTALSIGLQATMAAAQQIPPDVESRYRPDARTEYPYQKPGVAGDDPLQWSLLGGAFLALLGGLAASAAGGSDDAPAPEPVPTPPSGPAPLPNPGDPTAFNTQEYRFNYGLGMIGMSDRYAEGATGQDQIVAIYDSGAQVNHLELAGRVDHSLSYSYLTGSNVVTDTNGHGTHVAGIVASERNDLGTHGVAFSSQLMILQQGEGLRGDWLDAHTRAATAGAAAINNSWVYIDPETMLTRTIGRYTDRNELTRVFSETLIDGFEAAASTGLVSVFAAGNDGLDQVSDIAGIPVFVPELDGYWIAVVAVDQSSQIADFSNRCGMAQDFCLAAPGVDIWAPASEEAGYNPASIVKQSGTSMAAPHVAGAIAVLKSQFPELTGAEVSQILFETARDAGATGTDAIYGRGILDLSTALQPQGALTLKTGDRLDQEVALSQSGILASGPIAASLQASLSDSAIMVSDIYNRGYSASLGAFVSETDAAERNNALLAFASGGQSQTKQHAGLGFAAEATALYGDASWADDMAFGTPYAALATGRALAVSGQAGALDLTLRGAAGHDDSYASAEITAPFGGHALRLELGQLSERDGFLGTSVTGGFGGDMQAETRFARLAADLALASHTDLKLSASLGETDFRSSGILARGEGIVSTAFGAGLSRRDLFTSGDSFTLGASTPLAIARGRIGLDAPIAMQASTGNVRAQGVERRSSSIDLAGAQAPVDMQIGYSRPFAGGRAAVGAVWSEGRDRNLSISAGYSIQF